MHKLLQHSRKVASKMRHSRYRKRVVRFNEGLIFFVIFIGLFSYLTNPFTRFSVIKNPFIISIQNEEMISQQQHPLFVVDFPLMNTLGDLKAAWHLIANRFKGGGRGSKATTIDGIIDDIHTLRFNTREPYLISGDHFSVLYPRSLGIFYHTALDPRTARSPTDWSNRQDIYLKTTLYAMATYSKTKRLSTTIIPTGPESVTISNFFNPPSDTLYSLLYAIERLQSPDELYQIYPFSFTDSPLSLITTTAANKMLFLYKDTLQRYVHQMIDTTVDPTTGLIRTNISLSGAKDSVKRSGAFYDNVMLWKTLQLAQKLKIIDQNQQQLDTLKETILKTFWLPDKGYFLEELSAKSKLEAHYSSDWLIAFMTGFISVSNPNEREYFIRSIEFINKERLDKPFGLKYQPPYQHDVLHWELKIFAPSYSEQAIWSHWGMEYIKMLTVLYQTTCTETYMSDAVNQIQSYSKNILNTRGYPELYNEDGTVFSNPFYKSVFQTGWVVNFEEAKLMVEKTKQYQEQYCPKQ